MTTFFLSLVERVACIKGNEQLFIFHIFLALGLNLRIGLSRARILGAFSKDLSAECLVATTDLQTGMVLIATVRNVGIVLGTDVHCRIIDESGAAGRCEVEW